MAIKTDILINKTRRFMSSPALSRNAKFQPAQTVNELNNLYNQPAAGVNVMTMENTLQKTVISFALLLVTAAVGWFIPVIAFPAAIIALVLGLVNAFRKEPNVGLILAYAAFEGLFIGGISSFFETIFPGVVIQAVLASLVVVGVTLALFASGKVRATPKLTKFFIIATISYIGFSLINFGLMVTGVTNTMFGARDTLVFGVPLGIIIGIFAVLLATYSLIMDFTFIQNGINNRVEARYGWTAAFGLMVTIVWLYVEILRILAISRN